MATAAQISANQANARHSTGPRTQAGKAVSARNSTRHGFRSLSVLLPGDDPAEYEALLEQLREHFDPEDLTEDRCVREMADAEWRLRRVRGYIEQDLTRKIEELIPLHPAAAALELQALAYQALGQELAAWTRYESKFERQYDRAYHTWTQYQEGLDKRAKAEVWHHLLAVPPGPRRPAREPLPATPEPEIQNGTIEPNSTAGSTLPETVPAGRETGTHLVSGDKRRKLGENGTNEPNSTVGSTCPEPDGVCRDMGTDVVSGDTRRKADESGTNEANFADPPTPRNAPCPCGSGQKYKRCCGRYAPAVLSPGP